MHETVTATHAVRATAILRAYPFMRGPSMHADGTQPSRDRQRNLRQFGGPSGRIPAKGGCQAKFRRDHAPARRRRELDRPILAASAVSERTARRGRGWPIVGRTPEGLHFARSLRHRPWTVGALVNRIWSFTGDNDRDDVDSTFLQPFVNYSTKRGTSSS
jgi:hypothetical protein